MNNTMIVDGSYSYLAKEAFVFIDPDADIIYNQFQKIKITALPTQGSMQYLVNDSWAVTTSTGFVATGAAFPSNSSLHSGKIVFGDASGGGGGGVAWSGNSGIAGVNGSAAPDTLAGTEFEDIVFGDGSGGGAGSVLTAGNNNLTVCPWQA